MDKYRRWIMNDPISIPACSSMNEAFEVRLINLLEKNFFFKLIVKKRLFFYLYKINGTLI